MNILVAIDLSSASQKIIDKAKTLSLALPAKVCLLHVIEGDLDFLDDETDMQNIASTVFAKYGYQATVFGDPIEALDYFKGAPDQFDLLITDMTMPKMTGVELIHKVLAIRPRLPVVLCTGYSELINAEDAQKLRITGFLEKPFTMSKLLSVTRRTMRHLEQ